MNERKERHEDLIQNYNIANSNIQKLGSADKALDDSVYVGFDSYSQLQTQGESLGRIDMASDKLKNQITEIGVTLKRLDLLNFVGNKMKSFIIILLIIILAILLISKYLY